MKFTPAGILLFALGAAGNVYSGNTYNLVPLRSSEIKELKGFNDHQVVAGLDALGRPVLAQPDYLYGLDWTGQAQHLAALEYFPYFRMPDQEAPKSVTSFLLNNESNAVVQYADNTTYLLKGAKTYDLAILGLGPDSGWSVATLSDSGGMVAMMRGGSGMFLTLNPSFSLPQNEPIFSGSGFPRRGNRFGVFPVNFPGRLYYPGGAIERLPTESYYWINSLNDAFVALLFEATDTYSTAALYASGEILPINFGVNLDDNECFLNNWGEIALTSYPDAAGFREVTLWRAGKLTRLADEINFASNSIKGVRKLVAFNNLGQLAVELELVSGEILPALLNPAHQNNPEARLVNASILTPVSSDAHPVILGTFAKGPADLLVRAAGPALANFGVTDASPDTQLAVHSDDGQALSNDDWSAVDSSLAAAFSAAGAFAFDVGSKDAAVLWTGSGALTSVLTGSPGTALLETFDANGDASSLLLNVSSRVFLEKPTDTAKLGFVLSEGRPVRVMIRAVGEGLGQFGVTDALKDPKLRLRAGAMTVAVNNDGVFYDQARYIAAAGAFPVPEFGKDAALFLELPAGSYTAEVSSNDGSTGTVLIEIYVLPPATDAIPDFVGA